MEHRSVHRERNDHGSIVLLYVSEVTQYSGLQTAEVVRTVGMQGVRGLLDGPQNYSGFPLLDMQ